MIIITVILFFSFAVVVRSYMRVDSGDISRSDLIKATIFALISISCITLRETYFALPEGALVSAEYLNYRKILLLGFFIFMGYILRAIIYWCFYFYRKRT